MHPQNLANVCPISTQCPPNVPNFPNVFPDVHNIYQLSRMSAKCPQFLPYDLNICPMSPTSAQCRLQSNFGFLPICFQVKKNKKNQQRYIPSHHTQFISRKIRAQFFRCKERYTVAKNS